MCEVSFFCALSNKVERTFLFCAVDFGVGGLCGMRGAPVVADWFEFFVENGVIDRVLVFNVEFIVDFGVDPSRRDVDFVIVFEGMFSLLLIS